MSAPKRARSSAQAVDAAWKRVLVRMKRLGDILPMRPEDIDWDHLRHEAAEMHINLKKEDVSAHREDLTLIRGALGYIPKLPEVL